MEGYTDWKAFVHGFDQELVECVGGQALLDVERYCMNEGANIQAVKLKLSQPMKDAKKNMKDAKKAAKANDKEKAKKCYKDAIKNLEELKKTAENIDDDHIVMVMLDAFIKTFIPMFGGTLASFAIFGPTGVAKGVADIVIMVGSFINGMSKTFDASAAFAKGYTSANKQGKGGSVDPSIWWKIGETRAAVMTKLDRMITACEKGLDVLK